MLASTVVGTIVGIKLLRLAGRTRQLPDALIGTGLFAIAAVGQPGFAVGGALEAHGDGDLLIPLWVVVNALAYSAFAVTLATLSCFTWLVFGKTSRWRMALAALIVLPSVPFVAAAWWYSWVQLETGAPLPLVAKFGATPGFIAAFGWVAVESLLYYGSMRRRCALGLSDPIVANRFAVWGASSALSAAISACLLAAWITSNASPSANPTIGALMSAGGIVNAIGWGLTFAPPKVYVRWIRRESAASTRGSGPSDTDG